MMIKYNGYATIRNMNVHTDIMKMLNNISLALFPFIPIAIPSFDTRLEQTHIRSPLSNGIDGKQENKINDGIE